MRDHLPYDRLMFGTDFPHSVGSYPNSKKFLDGCFDGVDKTHRDIDIGVSDVIASG